MAVSGVPEVKINHAEPMASMALDMMQAMKGLRDPATKTPLTISIGIDSLVLYLPMCRLNHCLFYYRLLSSTYAIIRHTIIIVRQVYEMPCKAVISLY